MDHLDDLLQRVFRLSGFRPHQREIVEDVLAGHDVVCVMPTGAGKSLCFQLPALVLRGITVVVSPLISLMADQVQHLRQLGAPVLFLNSSQQAGEQREVLAKLKQGFTGLLYVAPERFSAYSFQQLIPQLQPKLFVVDEAHCLSFWGHDFRPEYMKLAEVRKALGSPPTLAATATATPQVRRDIATMLGLGAPKFHVTGFDRPNLAYASRRIEKEADKDAALLRFIGAQAGSGIVYCSTRRLVEELTALLQQTYPSRAVTAYHAGMDAGARRQSQEQFMAADNGVVVATNAFGMGINKPAIRFVVHYNLPASVEAYYQEAGRAGRDGQPAACLLYYGSRDRRTQEFFIGKIGDNNPALTETDVRQLQNHARRQLQLMEAYGESMRCRRQGILRYFGEPGEAAGCACDNCRPGANRYDSRPSPLRDRTITRGELRKANRHAGEASPLDGDAATRFERLRKVRADLAAQQKWPAFCIAHDSVLKEVARAAPQTLNALAQIKGIGVNKLEKFGAAFLVAVKGA